MNRRTFLGAAFAAPAVIALPAVAQSAVRVDADAIGGMVGPSGATTVRQWAEIVLDGYIAAPERLVIWVSAPAGYGKTVLAARLANRLNNEGEAVCLHYATRDEAAIQCRNLFGYDAAYVHGGPSGLRSTTARYFILDEPAKSTPEGAAIALAKKRTMTWADGKVLVFSVNPPPMWVDRHICLPKFDKAA